MEDAQLQIILQAVDNASQTLKQVASNLDQVTDSSKDTNEATGAFGESLAGVLTAAAGFTLANVVDQLVEAGKSAIDAAINFEATTQSLGTILGNIGIGGQQADEAFSGSAGHIVHTAEKTA